jgi:hypothetical protein
MRRRLLVAALAAAALLAVLAYMAPIAWRGQPPTTQPVPCEFGADRLRLPFPRRGVVAVGDIHGSISALRDVLQVAGLAVDLVASERDVAWSGGQDMAVVQIGDIVDRVRHDRRCIELLDGLQQRAREGGSCVYLLLGNHELNNLDLDFSSSSEFGQEAYSEFANDAFPAPHIAPEVAELIRTRFARVPEKFQARAKAFAPGGRMALRLAATRRAALVLGTVLFVHAGIPWDGTLDALEGLNRDMRAWMEGRAMPAQGTREFMDRVFQNRDLGRSVAAAHCEQLHATLSGMGISHVVVGHTVQVGQEAMRGCATHISWLSSTFSCFPTTQSQGINSACNGTVWRIDSEMMNRATQKGVVEALEITTDAGELRFRILAGTGDYRPPGKS